MSAQPPLRVAILGARGIGRAHARLFAELGARVTAVLGSTPATSAAAADDLRKSFGIDCAPFCDLDALLATGPDAVSLCTPTALHLPQLLAALDRQRPVFCEKPLLWEPGLTRPQLEAQLDRIAGHPHRRVFVNTSNAAFLAAVRDRLPPAAQARSFRFTFHTRGRFQGRDIALDLLPHGFSLLLAYLGLRPLSHFQADAQAHAFDCTFDYGGCRAAFAFREDPAGPRHLAFSADDRAFTRVSEGSDRTYRVALRDEAAGELLPARDPFAVYIDNFIKYCQQDDQRAPDAFAEGAANLRLMADCLLP